MGCEVTAKTAPVQHSSLQIEVVFLDSATTYQSSELVVKRCMKSLHGPLLTQVSY